MTAEEEAARLARRQRGRVTAAQLRGLGMGRRELQVRVRKGLLVAEHRGVYAYAHLPPVPFAKEHSALLACGEEAKLTHRSAGAVRRITPLTAAVDVTVPRGKRIERPGITVHQRDIERHEWVTIDGLRTTTPLRTLHDLAEILTTSGLRRAIGEAYALGLVEPGELTPRENTRGAPTMREALAEARITKSEVERGFLRLVTRAGIRLPDRTNTQVAGFDVDALWVAEGVAVEIDVFATHAWQGKFASDRRKDLALRAEGLDLRRYTDDLILGDPLKVVADLVRALAAHAASARPELRA